MAAPRIPDDFGGDRQFLVDPEATGLSTVVGDMAALNLQLIHALGDAVPADNRPLVANIAARTRQLLAASNASQGREQATRELRPITRIPDDPYGDHVNVANIRMHNVPSFTGTSDDSLDVVRWLSRILSLAQGNALTFAATINLMIQGSSKGAADYIEQMRDEGKTLSQVVQQLEMRYGDLCSPEEARVKCNNVPRKDHEGLSEFIDRLRILARMACRLEANEVARRQAVDILVEGNIRRALPSSVRNALEERVINRSRMGLPAFTAREVEKECLDLERRRDERRGVHKPEAGYAKPKVKQAHQAYQVRSQDPESEDDCSSTDEIDPEDGALYHLAMEVKEQRRKFDNKGQQYDPQQVYRKAFRKFNEKYPPPKFLKRGPGPQHGARQAGLVGAGAAGQNPASKGPPGDLDTSQKRTVNDLLELANCHRGLCIQCGEPGHYMHNERCALRDKVLTDRPCAKCGIGLHSADNCVKAFQQKYVSAPPQDANGEPLNGK